MVHLSQYDHAGHRIFIDIIMYLVFILNNNNHLKVKKKSINP